MTGDDFVCGRFDLLPSSKYLGVNIIDDLTSKRQPAKQIERWVFLEKTCEIISCFVVFSFVFSCTISLDIHTKGGAIRRHSCTIISTPGSYWTENNFQKWTFCMLWTFPKKLKIKFTHCLTQQLATYRYEKKSSFSCHEVIVKITISRNKNVLLKKDFIFRINK